MERAKKRNAKVNDGVSPMKKRKVVDLTNDDDEVNAPVPKRQLKLQSKTITLLMGKMLSKNHLAP